MRGAVLDAEQAAWLEAHRRALRAHCYRLTGNVADADDLVQETFLRAWRARDAVRGPRVGTHVALPDRDQRLPGHPQGGRAPDDPGRRRPRVEHAGRARIPDDDVAADEMVELALIAALMHLPPRQRAAFVLRDVDGWTPAEIADALGVAVPAANSLVQRGRETVRRHAPADPQDWRRPVLTAQDEEILRRYAAASGPEAFRMLLADDVRITMPPDAPVVGIDAVAEFLGRPLDWRTVPSSANGRPALVNYLWRPGARRYEALVVDVLRVVDGRIAEINAFVGPQHVAALGLPDSRSR